MNDSDIIEVNSDSIIDIYTDKFKLYIDLFMDEYSIEKLDNQHQWNACLDYIYTKLFKPSKNMRDNRKSIIDYSDIDTIKEVYSVYVKYCNIYKRMITIQGFCKLIGMSVDTFYRYASGNDKLSYIWSDLIKNIDSDKKETLDNKLYDSNNVTGQAILVNHYYGYNTGGNTQTSSMNRISSAQLPSLGVNNNNVIDI